MDLLRGVLKSVSRSIYLSLRVLPAPVRDAMGLAYLFCRAADTIADTRLLPRAERQAHLEFFRSLFDASSRDVRKIQSALKPDDGAERALLLRLDDCFRVFDGMPAADRALIRQVVRDVIEGMLMDFEKFPGESERDLAALPTRKDLEHYCYFIGGCPGIFWTKLCFEHLPSLSKLSKDEMLRLGTRYGKGLQMINILRDLPADLRIGRCYLPLEDLRRVHLSPSDLLDPGAWERCYVPYASLVAQTKEWLDDGLQYVLALPRGEVRLRMACAWPLLLARRTIAMLESGPNVLDPKKRVKVSRRQVYQIMALSTAAVYSKSSLRRLYARQGRGERLVNAR
jgi:farnesyl-diphosphate farnesyltransferase